LQKQSPGHHIGRALESVSPYDGVSSFLPWALPHASLLLFCRMRAPHVTRFFSAQITSPL
jgi:hypothetical protein